MAFILAQGGSSLYKIDPTSGVATALTLPSGVTLSTTKKPRFAVLNQWVIIVNSPSKNLAIDPEGTVRVLVPKAPTAAMNVAVGAGTGYTGTRQFKQSFIVNDSDGNLLMESPLSPASQTLVMANQDAALTRIAISEDSISARRIYTTSSLGTQYYQIVDLDGNVGTSINTNLADASLTLLPVVSTVLNSPPGTLGGGPKLKNIVAWKNRLWGVSDDPSLVDTVYYTDDGKVYAWAYNLTAYPKGNDAEGVIAFAPRRDQLGLLKRNGLWQIAGTSNANFTLTQIAVGKAGCIAPDSVVIINDMAYWLGRDGIYEWGPGGVKSISDELVDSWFKTDTYFNRSRFQYAFSRYNPMQDQLEVHIAAAGSSSEDRWVTFNFSNRKWYGPNKTAAFTPNSAALVYDANALPVVIVGGTNGILYQVNQTSFVDGTSSAIDMDVFTPFHTVDAPDIEHSWQELSMETKIQSGGTLTITPYVGRLDATAGPNILHDMTKGRERLRRIGNGPMLQFRFRENTANQNAVIYGYELPFHELGRR